MKLLASATSIYMTIQKMRQGSHIIAFTDNSSALGWMHKASFDAVKEEPHDMSDWCLLWKLVINEVSLYYQNIKGTEKIFTDSLSRDFHRSDKSPTTIFKCILPPHTKASLHIKPMTGEITSYILSTAESSTRPKEAPKPLRSSSMAAGKYGTPSSNMQAPRKNYWTESKMETRQH